MRRGLVESVVGCIAASGTVASREAIIVAVPVGVIDSASPGTPTLSLLVHGVVVIASVVRAPVRAPSTSLRGICRSIAVVRLLVARTTFFVLVAVAATARFLALVATLVIFVVWFGLLVLLSLVEATGDLFEPAVRDLVGAVHDTAQYEFLHLRLMVRCSWGRPGEVSPRQAKVARTRVIYVCWFVVCSGLRLLHADESPHDGQCLPPASLAAPRGLHVRLYKEAGTREGGKLEVASTYLKPWPTSAQSILRYMFFMSSCSDLTGNGCRVQGCRRMQ
jgi:hypothetical protein